MEKALIIEKSGKYLLNNNKEKAIEIINKNYKFEYQKVQKRSCSDKERMKIYLRDGFIDRYTGEKLLNPGILKVFSNYYPEEFPYQSHWKMDATHMAYWELSPTIDHIFPIAMGGEDNESNWVTTSMLHNSIKSNWTLEQIGWHLHECGNLQDWDGLTTMFVEIVDNDKRLLEDRYINKWYKISRNFEIL